MKTARKAILMFLLTVLFLVVLAMFAGAETYNGNCGANGDNLTWTLDTSTGVLAIDGAGEMKNYNYNDSPWYSYRDKITSVTLPSGLTSIGNYAFYSSNLKSVSVPNGVITIGDEAFQNCKALQNATLSDSVMSIGAGAFSICSALKNINLSNNLTSIGNSAFSSCEALKSVTISNGVRSIGASAFAHCKGLTSVAIPDSVTSIGDRAFYNCSNISNFSVESNNPAYTSDEVGCLYNKDKSTLIQYPIGKAQTSYVIPTSVTVLGGSAFSYASSLANITIPNSVISIGDSAFSKCTALKSIVIPDGVTSIGDYAFSYSGLTSIEFPNSVISIGRCAFYECKNLVSAQVSEKVTRIEEDTFFDCTSLKDLHLGKNIKYVGVDAFETGGGYGIYDKVYLDNLYFDGTIADWCNITFGDKNVGYVGYHHAAPKIKNLYIQGELMETVVIPEGITQIKGYAFWKVDCIKTLVLPKSLKSIGYEAFYHTKPQYVYFNGTMQDYLKIDYSANSSQYNETGNPNPFSKDTIFYVDGKSVKHVVVPKEITTIKKCSFEQLGFLESIVIPKNVTTITKRAFNRCVGLKDVYYEGSEAEWGSVSIGDGNDPLTSATIHYNYVSPHFPEGYEIAGQKFDTPIDYYAEYGNSSIYDPMLANLLCALSVAVYDSDDMLAAHASLGFCDGEYGYYNHYYDYSYDPNKCTYSIGYKTSCYSDDIICLISVKGTNPSNPSDWITDFKIATNEEGKHTGFANPANDIFAELQQLNEVLEINATVKYFITGHSLGAAVGNLLAVKLMETGVSKENVFAYTFACPDVACKSSFPDYDNIFNLCNYEDLVPFVPGILCDDFTSEGTEWGKFGRTYWFDENASGCSTFAFANHASSLYLKFFNNRWSLQQIIYFSLPVITPGYFEGQLVKSYCPVDVIVTNTDGTRIASVIGGEINYYDSSFGDVIIMTDGDKKAIFVKGGLDFNVELIGTDTGEMMYSVENYDLVTGETLSVKTFSNVALENGKRMYSPVSEAATTEDVELFVVKEESDQSLTPIYTIDTAGAETEIAHIWNDGEITKAATCTEEGVKTFTCTLCGDTYTKPIGKKAHTLTTINQKNANCTEKGYTGDQYCTVCKQTISKGSATNALGHTAPDGNGNCTRCGTHIKDVTPSQPQTNPNACKWCGKVHSGFFQSIVGFFHRILAAIFGAKY